MNSLRIQRLNALIKKYGTQAKLADAGDDINKAFISQIVNGHRPLGEKAARNLEKQLGLPEYYFDQPENNVSEPSAKYQTNSKVPLISRVSAGNWSEASDPFHPGDAEDWFPCPANHSSSTYALRVWGDSMTAPYGRSYPEGMIIYVDPEKEAVSGDRVIARVNGDTDVTFKQLIIEGSRRYLKALNPTWPIITDEFEVIGKVIGAYMEE